jgi:histidinol-phosphate aminotransferase
MSPAPLNRVVDALPATIPFIGPESLERQAGTSLRLRLGANESLFGPSPKVIEAIRQAALDAQLYGDPEGFALRAALARHHGVTVDHLVLGAGIDELFGMLAQSYLDPGDPVVMSEGGYPTFAYQIRGHGGVISTAPYRDYRNDLPALVELAHRVGAKLLFLANPDNPTGSYLPAAEQRAALDRLPENCLFVLDEAYAAFAPETALPVLAPDDPRVIRFRTFSKAHGLAGMRVGYALGAPALVRPFDRIRNQFGVGRAAQSAALAALEDAAYVAQVVGDTEAGKRDYAALAAAHGFNALPSATNFVAIDVGNVARARLILRLLLEREGVFIRMPGTAPLDRCIRVTVGRRADRELFADAFRRVIATL